MSSVTPSEERVGSPTSPLPLEDCFLNLQDICLEMSDLKPRWNMKSLSLFNKCTNDHKVETIAEGSKKPSETDGTPSNDQLPINNDAWTLLQEFESLYQANNTVAPTLHNQLIIENECNTLDSVESITDPLLLDIDELVGQLQPLSSFNHNAAEDISTGPDFSFSVEDPQAHTSDILASLITDTILVEPSLEGLLSNTTLDFSAVFGETVINSSTPVVCNVNEDARSVESCSPASSMQEVPDILVSSNNTKPRKRKVSSTSSNIAEVEKCFIDEDTSSESSSKQQKLSTKYVTMRQKNNEASRRSRFVRKQKFINLEQEASQLEEKNKKLKATAEKLENAVNALKLAMFKQITDLKK